MQKKILLPVNVSTKELSIKNILLLLLIVVATSCSITQQPSIDKDFIEKYIQTNDINSTIQLTAPEWLENTYKIGKPVFLMLENHSKELIVFPPDYGIQILAIVDGQWIKVENCLAYIPETEIILFPKGPDHTGDEPVACNPTLGGYKKPVKIRVLVIGTIQNNSQSENKKVAAYKDITLKP